MSYGVIKFMGDFLLAKKGVVFAPVFVVAVSHLLIEFAFDRTKDFPVKTFWNWLGKQAVWWGSHSLVWWVGHLTAIYVGLVILVVAARFDELLALPLNSLADFSAGVFGPVAFLWLVLGYKQQGDELKASSAALEAQVGELRSSMELQRSIAEKQDRMLDPVLYVDYVNTLSSNDGVVNSFVLINRGDTCRRVEVTTGTIGGVNVPHLHLDISVLAKDTQYPFSFAEVQPGVSVGIVISYQRLNGSKSRQGFSFFRTSEGKPIVLPFPVE